MTTMREIIRVLNIGTESSEPRFRKLLEQGGKYQIFDRGAHETATVDGDAAEVAEYLRSLIEEERKREEEIRRMAIIDKIAVFTDSHGTQDTDIRGLVEYAVRKTDCSYEKYWHAGPDGISIYDSWASHSFFDDGGGEEGYKQWSIHFVGKEGDHPIQNEKLNDLSTYELDPHGPTVTDSFYCEDPFGLEGIFKISFEGDWEFTD